MAKTATKTTTRRRKTKRTIATGHVHVHATFNNTIVTISDEQGNSIAWSSAGGAGFKGSRKSTPYAAGIAAERAAATAKDMGMAKVQVFVRGIGSGRESAIRALSSSGIQVSSIKDVTPIAHNGCRPRKPRRV
jgi:small subunit ribosomal protein S11